MKAGGNAALSQCRPAQIGGEMKGRVAAADGLRVIAIGLVMWFHIWQQSWLTPAANIGGVSIDFSPVARTGYMLVDVMLLLSGFLLFLPLARGGKLELRGFYAKRLARILPSYLLSVLAVFFIFALPNGEYASTGAMWKDLLTHLTFTHTFFFDTYVATKLNVVLWTLAIEMQFYLIFPFIARAFRKYPVIIYVAMSAFSIFFRKHFVADQPNVDMWMNQLPAFLDVYANGMLAALALASLEKRESGRGARIFMTAVAAICVVGIWRLLSAQYEDSFPMEARRLGQLSRRFELSALAAILLVSAEMSFEWLKKLLSNPVTRFLSLISFNAYIWHQFLSVKLKLWKIPGYESASPNQGEQPWQIHYTLLCFGASIALATILTYFFERPCTQKLTYLARRMACGDKKDAVK